MSWNRADSRYPIRNNIVHTPILQNPKRHGEYAYAHPASGDPSGGRDPTDLMYEGVHVRHWHGQEAVSADHAIARHHPPLMCAVTSPHSFGTGILCTFHGHPCMLLPHSVVRASEGGLMREDIDAVTRVAPPSTTAAPNKNDFFMVRVVPDPEVLWVCSPCPAPGQPRDAQHMDYALVAVHLPPELPEEWLRSLEDSAAYGFRPAEGQPTLMGAAPKRWLDPVFASVGKAAVGIHWRHGSVTRDGGGRGPGEGFDTSHEGAPAAAATRGGAVLACMSPPSAKAAGVRNSMAADARFARSVRPFTTPPRGCGDWGVFVAMHRGAAAGPGREGGSPESGDALLVSDLVRDLERRLAEPNGVVEMKEDE